MDVEDLTPTFNVDLYKSSLMTPIIGWGILQFLWLVFSFLDGKQDVVGYYGSGRFFSPLPFGAEITLLFGAWAGMSLAKNGSNTGDSLIGGLIMGLAAWIIWVIFFGVIDPEGVWVYSDPDLLKNESDFRNGMIPILMFFILLQIAGSLTIVGIMSDPPKPSSKPKAEKKAKVEKSESKADDKTAKKPTKKSTKKSTKAGEE